VTKSFYLTTPIYYVNDAPHIGHAYTTVAGDVLTRWHRQKGESVWFLTGTDEHGQKVMRTAEENNTAPQAWVDRLVQDAWKPNWQALNIANDDFIRTTEKRHIERVQKFLQSLKTLVIFMQENMKDLIVLVAKSSSFLATSLKLMARNAVQSIASQSNLSMKTTGSLSFQLLFNLYLSTTVTTQMLVNLKVRAMKLFHS